jgi:hypothetical protein
VARAVASNETWKRRHGESRVRLRIRIEPELARRRFVGRGFGRCARRWRFWLGNGRHRGRKRLRYGDRFGRALGRGGRFGRRLSTDRSSGRLGLKEFPNGGWSDGKLFLALQLGGDAPERPTLAAALADERGVRLQLARRGGLGVFEKVIKSVGHDNTIIEHLPNMNRTLIKHLLEPSSNCFQTAIEHWSNTDRTLRKL